MSQSLSQHSQTQSLAYKRRRYTAALHPEVVADLFHYVEAGVIDVNLASLLADVLGPGDWRNEAACRGKDVSLFFPDGQGGPGPAAARRICRSCPVRDECYTYANEAPELEGIWAGYSTASRRRTYHGATKTTPKFDKPHPICIDCFAEAELNSKSRCDTCQQKRRLRTKYDSRRRRAQQHGWAVEVHGASKASA